MTNEGQGKTGFSRADLLWGMFAVEADTQAREQLALSLGFELDEVSNKEAEKDRHDQQPTLSADGQHRDDGDEVDSVEEKQATARATTSSYYRIIGRKIDEPQLGSEQEDIAQLPAWFTEASPTILSEEGTRIPVQHQVFPLHTELTRWSRLEPFLKRVLGTRVKGAQIDAARLVKQVAEGESIQQIPRKERPGWTAEVCLLIDINADNFPYRRDFIHLREKLLQARGAEGLDIQYVFDEPGGYITRYQQQGETIEPWRAPSRETPLLILSDLGMHAVFQRPLYAWLVFGQFLKAQGIRPLVLLPVAERDMDKRLFSYFDCYEWDGTSDLKRIKGGYQAETDLRNHVESIEVLLCYFFATVRVDSALLRSIRYLVPGEPDSKQPLRFHPFDIGHEAAVWRHHSTIQDGDEWGWQPGSKENYLEPAVKLLKVLPAEKRQQLVELIGRYHATYTDELYFEAMFNLMLLEDQDVALAGLVPSAIRSATHQYMQALVKTYAENPHNKLLDSWVKRHLERHQPDNVRKIHTYWLPFMAFARLHEERRDGKAEVAYPDFLTKEEIAEISRYINHAKAFHRYSLLQKGEKIVLEKSDLAKEIPTVDLDWGHASTGSLLLNLSLNDERIFHIHTDSRGNRNIVSLNLEKIRSGFDFPATGKHEFQIGRERFAVDVSTAQQQKETWMKFIGSGSQGLYAESQTRGGDIYRWYWHPPEWSYEKGLLPGIWGGSKQLKGVQRDIYGVYDFVDIMGIPQRFRWIEPSAFMMGSPDGKNGEAEEGRYDDETQHEVILTQGYWLAETTCTQVLWQAVMGENPSSFKGDNNPVESVSWNDITEKFLPRVNKQYPELKFRLPTEAEWENACRAGTAGAFNFEGELSLDKVNYSGVFGEAGWADGALQKTAEVKSYPPNQWGLYEMHGNVYEWCQDKFSDYPAEPVVDPVQEQAGSVRVLRGGSWIGNGRDCRSADRFALDPSDRLNFCGFRLARGHELSPVRSVRAGQQPTVSHAAAARGGQAGDGQRGSGRRKKK